ncbi:SGNH hydrolase domain-containing protein [Nocardioides sp. 616]|uniref:SGNH hydrolase domain-containing protein n=1 Tax=Nocardioides sp. 616 TaxID=2268090 RepID=UPI0013B3D4D1|nr:SGNH hydrolase domain-containing protein [Nocardioides sp. 616]
MRNRVGAALLALALLGTLQACSEDGNDDKGEPTPITAVETPVSLSDLPTGERVVEDVSAAVETAQVPADLDPPLPWIATLGTLQPAEQRCVAPYAATELESPCVVGDPEATEEIVLWGDSHAAQWMPALTQIAAQTGRSLRVMVKYGCPPLLGLTPWLPAEDRPYTECTEFNDAAVEMIREVDPELVVMSGAVRGSSFVVDGEQVELGRAAPGNGWRLDAERDEIWQQGLASSIDEIGDESRVVVLGDTPYPGVDAGVCLPANSAQLGRCAVPRSRAVISEHNEAEAATATEHGAEHVDPTSWICTEQTCPAVVAGRVVYWDSFHLGRSHVLGLSRALGESLDLLE